MKIGQHLPKLWATSSSTDCN